MSIYPLVSVVVTTKNEERCLGSCLKSIQTQTYENIEIVVVDNNSEDKTVEIAGQYTDRVFTKGPERSAQRNYGMLEKAKGKYLMYVDADMVLSKDLVKEAVDKLEADAKMVGIYVPLRWVGNNWIIQARGFEREFYDATPLDAARVVRSETFSRIGGFDRTLFAGEDWDLDKRLREKGKIGLIRAVMYHHEDESITLQEFIRKMSYYSPNLNQYIEKWGKDDSDVKKQFGFSYRFLRVFVEDGKWHHLLLRPRRAVEMFFLKVLTGIIFVQKALHKKG